MLCTCYHRPFALTRGPLFRPSAARRNFTNTLAVCSNPPLSSPASSTTPTFSTPFTTSPPKKTSEKKEERTSAPSSTPTPPSPSTLSDAEEGSSKTKVGTVLKGINHLKDRQNPVAKADAEYPDWLWSLLDENKGAGGKDGEAEPTADLYSKSKKKRRQAMLKARADLLKPQSAKIPYQHQTIDLPTFDSNDLERTEDREGWDEADPNVQRQVQHKAHMAAQSAQKAREELVHAMRKERKKGIKESNFLKSMKM